MEQPFRLVLQEELVRRCRKNPGYSLRAFARSLKVAPSALSAMLNGKRPITSKSIQRLGLNLGLRLDEIREYSGEAENDRARQALRYNQVTLDAFALISDWYHYAILELMAVKEFRADFNWIAAALGITAQEARAAVERLQRLMLIEKTKDGKWRDTSGGRTTNIDGALTSSASRKLQKQILQQALAALENVDSEKRNHTSMTMAVDTRRLPEAVELTRKYRRDMSELLETAGKQTEVYQLSIALFPITDLKNNLPGGKR